MKKIEKYRIREKIYDNGKSEFFPEIYYPELRFVVNRPAMWFNFTKKGYETYDEAISQVNRPIHAEGDEWASILQAHGIPSL